MVKERRLHPRALVRMPAEILPVDATEWENVLLNDLSAGGAAVHTGRQIPVESEVRVRFGLPVGPDGGERRFEILCLVVRRGTLARPTREHAFFLGLHFLDLQGEDFDRVRAHVWKLRNPG